ncbi:hypothetical protein THOG05_230053 [Vibrio rotiferianus]|nr:hypothetical protein THOG05_230053 [Vibrio rotiferianus]CAH1575423.1 hypothetical protein THOE12_50056 [Vibrio rotiferianus]CAH1587067.1 hypothetical protein THOG10_40171 [Vibrio rotiferianus]CAH1589026.1 hypothetical protein THOB06_40170 [Vibrio rotiferianus]
MKGKTTLDNKLMMSATYIDEGDYYEKDEKSTVASCTYSILERHKN